MKHLLLFFVLITSLSGCITINDINQDLRKVDEVWLSEINKLPKSLLKRTINAPYNLAFLAVKKTFMSLNMPITKESSDKGFILSRNKSPNPLTPAQWDEVREMENDKLSEISWMISIAEEPDEQYVTIKAAIKELNDQSTISLSYYLDAPKMEDMGLVPMTQAPPHAVKLLANIFWKELDHNLPTQ